MKKIVQIFVVVSLIFIPLNGFAQSDLADFPLLSQGAIEPPPPPPGYAQPGAIVQPLTGTPPPPVLPQSPVLTPPAAQFQENFVRSKVKHIQGITKSSAKKLSSLMRSLYTFRTIIDKPESGHQLRRVINIGRTCSEILGLAHFPAPTRFRASSGDKVLRDRSYGSVEYRHFGDFDQRLNGWVKPIHTAVYADMIFTGKGRRRNHVRAQLTRTGTLDGLFYAYGWDKHGQPWKLQGTVENVLCRDDGLPSSGKLEIMGADPSGKAMKFSLDFPVSVIGEAKPAKKEIRHREGRPVHLGS